MVVIISPAIKLIRKSFGRIEEDFRNIDLKRDKFFAFLIKKYWPRFIQPNYITIARILIALIIGGILLAGYELNLILLIIIYFLCLFSDLIDGSVARTLNMKTKIGGFLDPLADKLLQIIIAIYLLWSNHFILLAVLGLLEITTAWGSVILYLIGYSVEANAFGKVKMFLQSVAFLVLLLPLGQNTNQVAILLLWIAVFFAIASLTVQAWHKYFQHFYED